MIDDVTPRTSDISSLPLDQQEKLAFARVVKWATAKELSSMKVRNRLAKSGFSPQVVDDALSKAMGASFIDDVRYADCLIRSTLSQGKELKFVLKEIESLGIDAMELDAYQIYLEEHSDDELDRALEYLRRHKSHAKNLQASCYRKLVTKGYASAIASEAAQLYCEEVGSPRA